MSKVVSGWFVEFDGTKAVCWLESFGRTQVMIRMDADNFDGTHIEKGDEFLYDYHSDRVIGRGEELLIERTK